MRLHIIFITEYQEHGEKQLFDLAAALLIQLDKVLSNID